MTTVPAGEIQGWVGVVGGILAALFGLFKYFNYRSRQDRMALVGSSFSTIVESLASENQTKQMAAAVLLRRFLDPETEQGRPGTPYVKEAVEVIAGSLRRPQPENLQKALADGLRYARALRDADLQHCDLHNAYLGKKKGDRYRLDLSAADLFRANLTDASLREVIAVDTVFLQATLKGTVFEGANVTGANFRKATLTDAKFTGATIGGAQFDQALDVPPDVMSLLDTGSIGLPGAVVGGVDASVQGPRSLMHRLTGRTLRGRRGGGK